MIAVRRVPLDDVIEGSVAAEEGRSQTQSAHANPELNYGREQVFGADGASEDFLSVAQSFDLGGKRGLRGEASTVRAEAVRREGDSLRLAVAVDARERFHDLLHRQLRVAALEAWMQHVAEALAIVSKREAHGDVATYDRRRLEREQVVAGGRLGSERANLERARARLQAILGEAAPVTVTGTLLPEAELPAAGELRTAAISRPDLLALGLRVQASGLESRAAERWWVPDLRLEGGWKDVNLPAGGRNNGYLVGASLALPFWDRSQGLARTAEGEARAARGQRELLEAELERELIGARSEAVQLRKVATDLRARVGVVSRDLARMAALGYEGGELGVLELLDAYRGSVDDELNALDIEHDARRSRMELDRLTGAALPRDLK